VDDNLTIVIIVAAAVVAVSVYIFGPAAVPTAPPSATIRAVR
jgi:hypothetical protein